MNDLPKTGIGNLDRKLSHLEKKLLEVIGTLHTPDDFISASEEMIQSLRHYTFSIQANKSNIENFDNWYKTWQEIMKRDTLMSWLKDKRTEIVHGDINFASSSAVIDYSIDYGRNLGFAVKDVRESTSELIEFAVRQAKENTELLHSVGKITRHYIVSIKDTEYELVDILAYGFYFMTEITNDLMRFLSDKTILARKLEAFSQYINPNDIIITFKLRTGKVIREKHKKLDRSKINIDFDALKKRYGLKGAADLSISNPKQLIYEIQKAAKQMLLTDGFHIIMLYARKQEDKTWTMTAPYLQDRADKLLFSQKLAESAKKEGYDRIIVVTESWTTNDTDTAMQYLGSGKEIADMNSKGEALVVSLVDKSGKCYNLITAFERDEKGNIAFTREDFTEGKPLDQGILWNVMEVWELVKPEDAQAKLSDMPTHTKEHNPPPQSV